MGNFHSIQSRAERRRTNRLSKPLTNKACLSPISPKTPAASSHVGSPVSPCSPTWKDPWSGNSIPINPPVSDCNFFLSQSLPSVKFQPETSRRTVAWNTRSESIAEESQDEYLYDLHNTTSNTAASMSRRPSLQPIRRASLQPETLRSYSQSPVNSRQPRRSYSLQSRPQGTKSIIYEDALEEATSSNTYFMVDNQRFSITRRRSLLTRPGVATRKPSSRQSGRRPSAIGKEHEQSSRGSDEGSKSSQPPLSQCEDSMAKPTFSAAFTRPVTPGDFGYTHLGALKLGSLRVVNRSSSPCPSDRTRSNIPPSSPPEVPSDNVSTGRNHKEDFNGRGNTPDCPHTQAGDVRYDHEPVTEDRSNLASSKVSTSMLQLPSLSDRKGQDDVPSSPFSFEKSPTATALPNQALLFAQEDEGISITNEGESLDSGASLWGNTHPIRRKASRPLAKADSGYSSATSVRSLQGKRVEESVDSRHLERNSWESCNPSVDGGFGSHNAEKTGSNERLPIQRHLSLRNFKASRYSSSLDSYPTTYHGTPPIRSNGFTRSSSFTVPSGPRRAVSSARPYVPLNSIELPVSDTGTLYFPQTQRAEATRDRLAYSYLDGYVSRPSGFRSSHHKSTSSSSPGDQRVPGNMGQYSVRNRRQFDTNAPSYDGQIQRQNTQRSATRIKPLGQFTADMTNAQCLKSNDHLRLNTEVPLPRSSFVLRQIETIEEKDSKTLPEMSCDGQNIEDQQRKFVRPRRRQNSIHTATSPFIFH